ncbi:type II secretion system protein [Yersinia entomophaga]|uniref:Type II secretion system protein n=2 Tax=Yersinia entomophaga TaxID=935293 RepID=A0ABN4PR62_YERET|nr:type II secretion system protein [Yersinia entomophaga]
MLLQQRPEKGWESIEQLLSVAPLADVDAKVKAQVKPILSVNSRYFWLRSCIEVNDVSLTVQSLIVRNGAQKFDVLWHQTGEVE